MLKKVFLSVILFSAFSVCAYAVDTSASSAVLMLSQTGEIIYSKNENNRRSMASTTKIMTSLIALENAQSRIKFKVTGDMLKVEGTSMGLTDGDFVSMEDLVYGMLLQSGNDAANVTAVKIAGNCDKFAQMMNKRAKEIGMKNTNFVTPSGLDDDNHYSTAYDMALLANEAIKNATFRKICSTHSARLSYGSPPYMRTLTNHNKLLTSCEGCIGIKTGFTKKSGRCLVTACERNGVTLICVTLNDPNDWKDHKMLFDYGFSQIKPIVLDKSSYCVNVAGGLKKEVKCNMSYRPCISTLNENDYSVKLHIRPLIFAPVEKGEIVGECVYYDKTAKEILSVPICASEGVQCNTTERKKEPSFSEKLKDKLKKYFVKR